MYYSLALEPDAQTYQQAARMRQHFDPIRAGYMRPHITLKQPFKITDNTSEQQLIALLKNSLKNQPAITLKNLGVSYFESKHYNYVVHWQLENSAAFVELTKNVASAVAPINADIAKYSVAREVSNTFPHLTLAQQIDLHTAIVAANSKLTTPMQSSVRSNTIVLAKSTNFQQWEVIKLFELSENIFTN